MSDNYYYVLLLCFRTLKKEPLLTLVNYFPTWASLTLQVLLTIFRLNMPVMPKFCAPKHRNSVLFSLHCLFSSELFSQPKPSKSSLLLSYCSELLQVVVILMAIAHPELCPWFKRPACPYAVTCCHLAWNLTCWFLQATKKTYFIKSLRLERTFKTIEMNC